MIPTERWIEENDVENLICCFEIGSGVGDEDIEVIGLQFSKVLFQVGSDLLVFFDKSQSLCTP